MPVCVLSRDQKEMKPASSCLLLVSGQSSVTMSWPLETLLPYGHMGGRGGSVGKKEIK